MRSHSQPYLMWLFHCWKHILLYENTTNLFSRLQTLRVTIQSMYIHNFLVSFSYLYYFCAFLCTFEIYDYSRHILSFLPLYWLIFDFYMFMFVVFSISYLLLSVATLEYFSILFYIAPKQLVIFCLNAFQAYIYQQFNSVSNFKCTVLSFTQRFI